MKKLALLLVLTLLVSVSACSENSGNLEIPLNSDNAQEYEPEADDLGASESEVGEVSETEEAKSEEAKSSENTRPNELAPWGGIESVEYFTLAEAQEIAPEYFVFFDEEIPSASADIIVSVKEENPRIGIIQYNSFGYLAFPWDNTPTKIFVGDEILGAKVTGARTIFTLSRNDGSNEVELDGTEIFLEGEISFTGTLHRIPYGPYEGALAFNAFESSYAEVPDSYPPWWCIEGFNPEEPGLLQFSGMLVVFNKFATPGLTELAKNEVLYNLEELPDLFKDTDAPEVAITFSKLRFLTTSRTDMGNCAEIKSIELLE